MRAHLQWEVDGQEGCGQMFNMVEIGNPGYRGVKFLKRAG